jgi:hypothetical protein
MLLVLAIFDQACLTGIGLNKPALLSVMVSKGFEKHKQF